MEQGDERMQSALLLGQQHQNQWLKETKQTYKEGCLCAWDCTEAPGADCAKKNASHIDEHIGQHWPPTT